MAQYKTNEEAGAALSAQLQAKARELKPIYDSKDPKDQAKAEQLKADIGAIQNQLMVLSGGVGAFGGGLAKGVVSAATAIPDLARMAGNYFTGSKNKLFGEQLSPGLEVVSNDKTTQGLFGVGKGLGSSLGLGKTMTALQTGATTFDEMAAGGDPIAQSILAIATLGKGGYDVTRNIIKNKQVNKLMSQLPAEDANALQQFMVRGQDVSDPTIAGKIAALRSNPKYAELFTVLEKKATEAATAGARAEVNPLYPKGSAGQDIYQATQGEIAKLRENIKVLPASRYDAALKMGGNNDILMTDNVVKNIDNMIVDFGRKGTDDARAAQAYLGRLRENILESGGRISVEKMQALTSEFGSQAKQGEQLITDVSLGTQKRIASAIFGGLKDDLQLTAQTSTVPRIRELSRILDSAVDMSAKAYGDYNKFIAQGLPAKLKDVAIDAVDTQTLLNTIKGLSNEQRTKMATILQDTQPEALKRVKQVMYDDFVQSARTELPDGSKGVDLKLLAHKFSTLDEPTKDSMAFILGTNVKDFENRMSDANKYFTYMQKYGKDETGKALSGEALAELSTLGYVTSGYGAGKVAGLTGRLWNTLKGGLTDEQTLNLLISPETKGILREAVTNPNSIQTLDRIEKSIFNPAARNLVTGTQLTGQAIQNALPSGVAPATQGIPTERPALDLTVPDTNTPTTIPGERPSLDLSYNPTDIEKQIRDEAKAQGLGQYADLFVRQAKQESGFNPYAVSKAGAAGVFQHMPATAQELGINPFDTTQSIQGGVKYMGQLLNKYNNDPTKALAAYNWGMGNLDRQGLGAAPAETQNYLKNILGA
jgi:Transglycosylase SLT domain